MEISTEIFNRYSVTFENPTDLPVTILVYSRGIAEIKNDNILFAENVLVSPGDNIGPISQIECFNTKSFEKGIVYEKK